MGEVKLARGLFCKRRASIGVWGSYTPSQEVNYKLWSGPAPMLPLTRPRFHKVWHWQWYYGNGDIGNQCVHQMDIAHWGLDLDTLASRVLTRRREKRMPCRLRSGADAGEIQIQAQTMMSQSAKCSARLPKAALSRKMDASAR